MSYLDSFFIGWLAEAPCPLVFASGHALGPGAVTVFNQLVRSRAQLLVAEELFVPSEQAKKTPVIEIPTVKWKEGGLLVARPSRGLPPRDQLSIGN